MATKRGRFGSHSDLDTKQSKIDEQEDIDKQEARDKQAAETDRFASSASAASGAINKRNINDESKVGQIVIEPGFKTPGRKILRRKVRVQITPTLPPILEDIKETKQELKKERTILEQEHKNVLTDLKTINNELGLLERLKEEHSTRTRQFYSTVSAKTIDDIKRRQENIRHRIDKASYSIIVNSDNWVNQSKACVYLVGAQNRDQLHCPNSKLQYIDQLISEKSSINFIVKFSMPTYLVLNEILFSQFLLSRHNVLNLTFLRPVLDFCVLQGKDLASKCTALSENLNLVPRNNNATVILKLVSVYGGITNINSIINDFRKNQELFTYALMRPIVQFHALGYIHFKPHLGHICNSLKDKGLFVLIDFGLAFHNTMFIYLAFIMKVQYIRQRLETCPPELLFLTIKKYGMLLELYKMSLSNDKAIIEKYQKMLSIIEQQFKDETGYLFKDVDPFLFIRPNTSGELFILCQKIDTFIFFKSLSIKCKQLGIVLSKSVQSLIDQGTNTNIIKRSTITDLYTKNSVSSSSSASSISSASGIDDRSSKIESKIGPYYLNGPSVIYALKPSIKEDEQKPIFLLFGEYHSKDQFCPKNKTNQQLSFKEFVNLFAGLYSNNKIMIVLETILTIKKERLTKQGILHDSALADFYKETRPCFSQKINNIDLERCHKNVEWHLGDIRHYDEFSRQIMSIISTSRLSKYLIYNKNTKSYNYDPKEIKLNDDDLFTAKKLIEFFSKLVLNADNNNYNNIYNRISKQIGAIKHESYKKVLNNELDEIKVKINYTLNDVVLLAREERGPDPRCL